MDPVTLDDLWSALSEEQRREAAQDFWEMSKDRSLEDERDKCTKRLASAFGFRPKFMARASAADKAKWLMSGKGASALSEHRKDLLRAWLLCRQLPMIEVFLNAQGIPHAQGLILEESSPPTAEGTVAAVTAVLASFPHTTVGVYFGYLLAFNEERFCELGPALESVGQSLRGLLGVEPPALPQRTPPELAPASGPAEAPAKGGGAADPARPAAGEFSTLDRLLTRSIVATAFGEVGALDADQLVDLVDEAVELNAARQHTLFHRGFLHAVLGKPFAFHFPGENDLRRMWYFTGALIGLLRNGEQARCVTLLLENEKLADMVLRRTDVSCGAILLPHLYLPLIEAGKIGRLRHWIASQIGALEPDARCWLLAEAQSEAERFLRSGKPSEASLLLDAVRDALEDGHDYPDGFRESLAISNTRRRAQVLQTAGRPGEARVLFEKVAESSSPVDTARALGAIGLIQAGFKSLEAALPRSESRANVELCAALLRGRQSFERAVAVASNNAIKGHWCLGVVNLLSAPPEPARAADHLRHALDAMLRREPSYGPSGLIAWTRFCLGVAMLETLDEGSLHAASDLMDQSCAADVRFHLYLWERAIRHAAEFADTSLAERLCRHLLESRERGAHQLLAATGLYRHNASLRKVYFEWLTSEEPGIDVRWKGLRAVLESALNAGELELGGSSLDALEAIADKLQNRRREFLELLDNPAGYSPAWEPEDAEAARVRQLELEGDWARAAQVLQQRFYRLVQQGTPYHLAQARQVIEQLEGYPLDGFDLKSLSRALEAEAREVAKSLPLAGEAKPAPAPVRLLYIGGNEIQQQYENPIRQSLARERPWIEVTFMFPGWTSNWHVPLEDVKRRIPSVDAVVLSPLVRTQFGRHVRALCDERRPWFACTGRGRQSLSTSITRAAEYVVSRRSTAGAKR